MQKDKGRTEELIAKLDQSIVYQMSLNSHELFHSNLWVWLMEKEPAVIELFFPGVTPSEICREEGNRDITIWEGNGKHRKAYVIENKFKSIPTSSQLIGYQSSLGTNFAQGLLTGIREPSIPVGRENLEAWNFLSYQEIAAGLMNICETTDKWDQFTKTVVEQYADMIELLCKIVAEDQNDNTDHIKRLDQPSDEGLYQKTRIRDLLIKMHADAFCAYLRQDPEYKSLRSSLPNGCQLVIIPGFTRKSGLVDIFIQQNHSPDGKEFDFRIGVQIQDKKCKLFVNKRGLRGAADVKAFFEKYQQLGWFENYDLSKKQFKGYDSSMKPKEENSYQFNKYISTNSTFIYQYFDLPPAWTDGDAKRKIYEFMDLARSIS